MLPDLAMTDGDGVPRTTFITTIFVMSNQFAGGPNSAEVD